MAKVVGRDESSVKRCTCRKCAAIIEYTESELQVASGRDYSGDGYTQYSLPCPSCGSKIIVRES